MDIPKAKFVCSRETEVERVVHAAKQTWSGFYIKKGFLVLPEIRSGGIREVVLPDIGLEKITDVEKILQGVSLNFPIKVPDVLETEILNKIEVGKVDADFENEWRRVEKAFWNVVNILVPEVAEKIKNVEVRITRYGTISSYQYLSKGDEKLIVYLRQDAQVSNLAEAILTAMIYPYLGELGMAWEESEAMVDFVIKNSILRDFFGEHTPTLKSLREKGVEKDRVESRNFIKKLGIVTEEALKINNKKIELLGKPIDSKLTKKQNEILALLISKKGTVVNFEEVSKILWDDEDKFSLWAMNKFIERLRLKLVGLGLSPFVLRTVRGRGVSVENI
jgi:hypothetical protein